MKMRLVIGVALICFCIAATQARYAPDWGSLDARPLPSWYDEAKFGIFIHWGVFSVPSYCCGQTAAEWYWWGLDGSKDPCIVAYQNKAYPPGFQYQDLASQFTASLFNATEWADTFKRSGAKYVVLTSKHHEGFCNWPSPQSWNWNSMDVGPHQDNVGLVTKAVRDAGLRMGLYHSLFEWFNPLYLADKASGGKTQVYVDEILHPQLHDIVTKYKPEVIWSDGDWEMPDSYWKSKEFLAWLYNESPVNTTVVVNDRWGSGDSCKHGGYWTCEDRYDPGKLINHKWENALTIDRRTWGYARNSGLEDYLSIEELLGTMASTVSCGGNMLLNVGPTADGRITPIYKERLVQIGDWLEVNGEAIYETKPWRAQNDSAANDIWYTSRNDTVYAIVLDWPANDVLTLTQPKTSSSTAVTMLGFQGKLPWKASGSTGMQVVLPQIPISLLPNTHAWVLKLTGVS